MTRKKGSVRFGKWLLKAAILRDLYCCWLVALQSTCLASGTIPGSISKLFDVFHAVRPDLSYSDCQNHFDRSCR